MVTGGPAAAAAYPFCCIRSSQHTRAVIVVHACTHPHVTHTRLANLRSDAFAFAVYNLGQEWIGWQGRGRHDRARAGCARLCDVEIRIVHVAAVYNGPGVPNRGRRRAVQR